MKELIIPVDPKRDKVKAKLHSDPVVLMAQAKQEPGLCEAYTKSNTPFLVFACPGCGNVRSILVGKPKPEMTPSWEITEGSLDDPTQMTLSPSIDCKGCCGWHGFLTKGMFQLDR